VDETRVLLLAARERWERGPALLHLGLYAALGAVLASGKLDTHNSEDAYVAAEETLEHAAGMLLKDWCALYDAAEALILLDRALSSLVGFCTSCGCHVRSGWAAVCYRRNKPTRCPECREHKRAGACAGCVEVR
jgi:hypothetical protein